MKAWLVEDVAVDDCYPDEVGEYQAVVHAVTRNEAKTIGFTMIRNAERYIDLRARRYPCMDGLSATDWNLYTAAGWFVYCAECQRKMDSDRWDDENDVPYEPVQGRGGEALCSQRCKDDWERRMDHSCLIAWRGVLNANAEQEIVPIPLRERDQTDFNAMWRIVDANRHGYWKMRVPV